MLSRRSLLASIGAALPAALFAAGAHAATSPTVTHHHKKRHAHTASAHGAHHRKPHRTASAAHPRSQA